MIDENVEVKLSISSDKKKKKKLFDATILVL